MTQNPPDLSVVTVVLNDRNGLIKTIDSINQQKLLSIEHIIVDGGSSDGSAEVAHEHSAIHIESKPDGGIYPAMHRGAIAAKGHFVIFCNAGDALFGETFLAEAVSQLRRSNSMWGFGPIIEQTQRGTYSWIGADEEATSNSIISRRSFVPFPSFIINRRFYSEIGPLTSEYRIAGDFELISKAAMRCLPVVFAQPIAIFSAGGISYTRADVAWKEEIRIRTDLLKLNFFGQLNEWFNYSLRFIKWRLGKVLDYLNKFYQKNGSWRDYRATAVPEIYRANLPKDL